MSDELLKFLNDDFMPVVRRQATAVERIAKYMRIVLTPEQLAALQDVENPNAAEIAERSAKALAAAKAGREAAAEKRRAAKADKAAAKVAKEAELMTRSGTKTTESPLPEVDIDNFLVAQADSINAKPELPIATASEKVADAIALTDKDIDHAVATFVTTAAVEKLLEEPVVATPPPPVTLQQLREALTALSRKDGNRVRALALMAEHGDKAEVLPGSEAAVKGGVKVLEEKFFRAVRDAALTAAK